MIFAMVFVSTNCRPMFVAKSSRKAWNRTSWVTLSRAPTPLVKVDAVRTIGGRSHNAADGRSHLELLVQGEDARPTLNQSFK